MEKQVEVKKKNFEKRILIGLSFALLISTFVFASQLFSDTSSGTIIIEGDPANVQVTQSLGTILMNMSSGNLTGSLSKEYATDRNITANVTFEINKIPADISCDYENDCSVNTYFIRYNIGDFSPITSGQLVTLTPDGLNPNHIFPNGSIGYFYETSNFPNEFKFEVSCVISSCDQTITPVLSINEVL